MQARIGVLRGRLGELGRIAGRGLERKKGVRMGEEGVATDGETEVESGVKREEDEVMGEG